jgi:hypothetical protein
LNEGLKRGVAGWLSAGDAEIFIAREILRGQNPGVRPSAWILRLQRVLPR